MIAEVVPLVPRLPPRGRKFSPDVVDNMTLRLTRIAIIGKTRITTGGKRRTEPLWEQEDRKRTVRRKRGKRS